MQSEFRAALARIRATTTLLPVLARSVGQSSLWLLLLITCLALPTIIMFVVMPPQEMPISIGPRLLSTVYLSGFDTYATAILFGGGVGLAIATSGRPAADRRARRLRDASWFSGLIVFAGLLVLNPVVLGLLWMIGDSFLTDLEQVGGHQATAIRGTVVSLLSSSGVDLTFWSWVRGTLFGVPTVAAVALGFGILAAHWIGDAEIPADKKQRQRFAAQIGNGAMGLHLVTFELGSTLSFVVVGGCITASMLLLPGTRLPHGRLPIGAFLGITLMFLIRDVFDPFVYVRPVIAMLCAQLAAAPLLARGAALAGAAPPAEQAPATPATVISGSA